LAAAADASLGHYRAGIGQGELGHVPPAGADPPASKRGRPLYPLGCSSRSKHTDTTAPRLLSSHLGPLVLNTG
jgi:hypothetical protein